MKQKEFLELAEEMERECGDWENSEGMSQEALDSLIAKVEAMDRRKQASKKRGTSKKVVRFQKRYIIVLAAALALLMGTGVVGDRVWIAENKDIERETEVTTKVDNEEKDSILYEEEDVYQEIADKLGIAPMWLGYTPEGMKLDSYTIMENTGFADVNYLYGEKLVYVQMVKKSVETSTNIQWDGEAKALENVTNRYGYEIEAYCMDVENHNYTASLTYGNGYYNISGSFEKEEEFLEILYRIYFKDM